LSSALVKETVVKGKPLGESVPVVGIGIDYFICVDCNRLRCSLGLS
jgi:hypothetical protein